MDKARKEIIGQYLVASITLLILLGFNLPWLPDYFDYDVDASWIYALHLASAKGWQFGQDIVWHYGPLGFLYAKYYYPDTYNFMLSAWAVLSVIFFRAIYVIITRSHEKPNLVALPVIAVVVSQSFDAFFLAFPVLFIIHYLFIERSNKSLLNWLLIISCAAISLIKISFFLLAFFVALLVGGISPLREKRFPVFFFAYLIAYAAIWILLGQSISNIPSFLHGAFEHGTGFGAAMAWRESSVTTLLLYIAGALIFLLIVGRIFYREAGRKSLIPTFSIAAALFIGMKVGFLSGNDTHVYEAVAIFIVIALLMRDLFFDKMGSLGKGTLAVYSMVIVSFAVFGMTGEKNKLEIGKIIGEKTFVLKGGEASASTLANLFENKKDNFNNAMERMRERAPLLKIDGPVDLYNSYQIGLLAYNMDYRPRPVLQAYHSFTPYLTNLNRDFLKSREAPDNILFNIDVMMNRYPSIDDGLSWPELLTRYDIEKIYGNFLYLRKLEKPREYKLTQIEQFEAGFDIYIPLPDAADKPMIWANIYIKPTILGRLANIFFRNVYVDMSFVTKGGYKRTNRIVPSVAGEGFLLSPLIDNQLQFANLARGRGEQFNDLKIEGIKLRLESNNWLIGWLYNQVFEIKFSELEFEPQTKDIEGWESRTEIAAKLTSHPLESYVSPIENVVDRHITYSSSEVERYIKLNGAARLYYPLSGNEKYAEAEYGTYNQFYFIRELTEGIDFRVYGVNKETGEEKMLWQGKTGKLEQTDRGENKVLNLDFTPDLYKALIFETKPVDDKKSNWCYWANLNIK